MTQKEISSDSTDLVLQAREKATVNLMPAGAKSADIVDLVKQLRDHKRLTPSLILRALCTGDINFEASLGVLSNTPIVNAQALIHDEGGSACSRSISVPACRRTSVPAYRVALMWRCRPIMMAAKRTASASPRG